MTHVESRTANIRQSARGATPDTRRAFRLLLVAALLSLALGGCSRAIQAMPLRSDPAPVEPAVVVTPAAIDAGDSLPALPALRSIFAPRPAGARDGAARVRALSARESPLASPQPAATEHAGEHTEDSIWGLLPTPTPTPVAAAIALSSTAPAAPPVPDAITIADLLDDSLPDGDAQPAAEPEPQSEAPLVLPTSTAQPDAAPVLAPTPDGILRSVSTPILMYHYLSVPPQDADIYRLDLSVTPELFAAHLDAIQAAGYTTISLYDLYAHLVQGAPLPEKSVVITFDDGYRDNYENALPLLRERGMVATFFVVTDFMDEERPEYLTWDMAREMLSAGMRIESHGRNHVSLQEKPLDYLVWQALGSMETIEFELGVRPRFVSYPAGEYDKATADVFAGAGYWAGATTRQGATHSSDSLFDLRRVRVRGTTTPDELLRLLALDW